jgi:hypothetical protein
MLCTEKIISRVFSQEASVIYGPDVISWRGTGGHHVVRSRIGAFLTHEYRFVIGQLGSTPFSVLFKCVQNTPLACVDCVYKLIISEIMLH